MKAIALAALALAACAEPSNRVVVWHAYNGAEQEALAASAARWNAQHADHPIELVAVPYAAFADKLTSAIPGGNGPDLFIYPQDRIGDWADSGAIEPIEFWLDDARVERFVPEAVGAMAYKGSLYGLPMSTKSLALFYRTDFVAAPPATTDQLFELARDMKDHKRDGYALAYANVDLYGHAPWLFGSGGKILDDSGKLALASTEAANAMLLAKRFVDQKVAPARAEGPQVAALFNDGRAATAISGPWFIAGIDKSVPWKVAPLPIVSTTGKPAAPFFGAEGLLMSARAKDKDCAFQVMDFLTSDVEATSRAKLAQQVVPNVAAYRDPAIAADTTLQAFRAQLETAVPMPKGPAMRMVWTPYKAALDKVLDGSGDAGTELLAVEREVEGYLKGAGH